MNIEQMIDELVKREAGYVNNPNDPGGETNFGITLVVARAYGWKGRMIDLPYPTARAIYRERYWTQPKFDQVSLLSPKIAEEMLDTGVNMGQGIAAKFLQRALNFLNRQAKDFPDIAVDGAVGKMTLYCLKTYLDKRGAEGETVIFRLLNDQQGVRYIELAEANQRLEEFSHGWVAHRVS